MTMPMVMCHWASPATATGSARVDILGCSAALPCWCLTAGHWGVLCHQLRTAKCLQLSHPHLRKWSKKGNRTFLTLHLDTTCPQELYLFLSGTGPGTNPYFTDWGVILVVLFGAKHQCIAWNSRPKWMKARIWRLYDEIQTNVTWNLRLTMGWTVQRSIPGTEDHPASHSVGSGVLPLG